MKLLTRCLPLALLLCSGPIALHAQSAFDVFFGLGTATDKSRGPIDALGDGNVENTAKMNGVFGKFGADIMLWHDLGVGGEADLRFSQGKYTSEVNYRPSFYDAYAIFQPIHTKRVSLRAIGGIGAAKVSFYYPSNYCDQLSGCSSSNSFLESSSHFQVHLGAGLDVYVTDHVFLRPAIDVHYVNNFFQFGSNWVPEYSVSIGYRFGEH